MKNTLSNVSPVKTSENAVEMLEEWLARAKKGEFRAVAIAGVVDGGSDMSLCYDRMTNPDTLIGVVARLQVFAMEDPME